MNLDRWACSRARSKLPSMLAQASASWPCVQRHCRWASVCSIRLSSLSAWVSTGPRPEVEAAAAASTTCSHACNLRDSEDQLQHPNMFCACRTPLQPPQGSWSDEYRMQDVQVCWQATSRVLSGADCCSSSCRTCLPRRSRTQTVSAWQLGCTLDLCSAMLAAAYLWLQTCCGLLHRLAVRVCRRSSRLNVWGSEWTTCRPAQPQPGRGWPRRRLLSTGQRRVSRSAVHILSSDQRTGVIKLFLSGPCQALYDAPGEPAGSQCCLQVHWSICRCMT